MEKKSEENSPTKKSDDDSPEETTTSSFIPPDPGEYARPSVVSGTSECTVKSSVDNKDSNPITQGPKQPETTNPTQSSTLSDLFKCCAGAPATSPEEPLTSAHLALKSTEQTTGGQVQYSTLPQTVSSISSTIATSDSSQVMRSNVNAPFDELFKFGLQTSTLPQTVSSASSTTASTTSDSFQGGRSNVNAPFDKLFKLAGSGSAKVPSAKQCKQKKGTHLPSALTSSGIQASSEPTMRRDQKLAESLASSTTVYPSTMDYPSSVNLDMAPKPSVVSTQGQMDPVRSGSPQRPTQLLPTSDDHSESHLSSIANRRGRGRARWSPTPPGERERRTFTQLSPPSDAPTPSVERERSAFTQLSPPSEDEYEEE